jgi:hypothetical protein
VGEKDLTTRGAPEEVLVMPIKRRSAGGRGTSASRGFRRSRSGARCGAGSFGCLPQTHIEQDRPGRRGSARRQQRQGLPFSPAWREERTMARSVRYLRRGTKGRCGDGETDSPAPLRITSAWRVACARLSLQAESFRLADHPRLRGVLPQSRRGRLSGLMRISVATERRFRCALHLEGAARGPRRRLWSLRAPMARN